MAPKKKTPGKTKALADFLITGNPNAAEHQPHAARTARGSYADVAAQPLQPVGSQIAQLTQQERREGMFAEILDDIYTGNDHVDESLIQDILRAYEATPASEPCPPVTASSSGSLDVTGLQAQPSGSCCYSSWSDSWNDSSTNGSETASFVSNLCQVVRTCEASTLKTPPNSRGPDPRAATVNTTQAAARGLVARAPVGAPADQFPSADEFPSLASPPENPWCSVALRGKRKGAGARNVAALAKGSAASKVKVLHRGQGLGEVYHVGGDDDVNLKPGRGDLWWDLRLDGMAEQAADALDHTVLDQVEPEVRQAIKAREEAEAAAEGGGSSSRPRGVSVERMRAMMANADRQRSGDMGDGDDEWAQDYYNSVPERKALSKTLKTMLQADWVPVKGGDKHLKYRRELPNGKVQTQIVASTPSDVNYIHNINASLARQDREANEVRAKVLHSGKGGQAPARG